MSDIVHVIRAQVDPSVAPSRAGQHWVNETTKQTWLSVGTSTVADWILFGDALTVKASVTDTTAGFLDAKLAAGTGIAFTVLNPGANEVISISAPGSTTDEKVKVSATDTTAGYLNSELTVSNGTNSTNPLEKSITSPSGDEKLNIQFDQTKLSLPSTQISDFTEAAQDAVGNVLTDSSSIDFTYNDAGNSITAVVLPGGVNHNLLLNYVANEHINHTSVSLIAGTGISATGLGDLTASRTINIANTTVAASSYGSATQVATFTVNAQGQLTAASNTSIQITESQVTNLTTDLAAKVPNTRNIFTGTGLTGGGDLSADRTISFATVSTGAILANISGLTAAPIPNTLTAIIDNATSTTQGSILYRNATSWVALAPGTSGQVLGTGGASANPSWISNTAGSVTSVALSLPSIFTVSGSPVTSSGTLTGTLNTQSANTIFAGPTTGAATVPTFRSLVAADIPALSYVTSIATGTGLTGGPITSSGTISIANTSVTASSYGSATQVATFTVNAQGQLTAAANVSIQITESQVTNLTTDLAAKVPNTRAVNTGTGLTGGGDLSADRTISFATIATGNILANISGSTAAPVANTLTAIIDNATSTTQGSILYRNATTWVALAPGTSGQFLKTQGASANPVWSAESFLGTVTSVAMSVPSFLSVAGSPITSSGTLAVTLATQSANTIFAGPTTGAAATPTFRTQVLADLPQLTNGQLYIGSTSASVVAASLTAGSGITITPGAGTITIARSSVDYWSVDTTLDAGGLLTWADQTGQDLVIRQASASGSPYVRQIASRGTLAAPTASLSGDRLGGNGYYGWKTASTTGVDSLPAVAFNGYATENHTSTANGGELRIEVIPNGSVTPVTTATFENTGDLVITGAIRLGTTTETIDGYVRYTGTELQVRESGVWRPVSNVPTSTSSSSAVNSTSSSFATLSLSSTPVAGSYILNFTASAQISTSASTGEWSVFVGGTQQTITNRRLASVSATTIQTSVAISTIITVNGSQTVDVQFRRSAGTGTVTTTERELLLTPYAR